MAGVMSLLLVIGLCVLAIATLVQARNAAVTVPAMFTFGDSLVDCGNNNFLSSLARADFPPNGIDFMAASPTGRFTNGRTLADYVGYFLGLDLQPAYYSTRNSNPEDLCRGVNFASAGAGILDESGAIFKHRIPLSVQVNYFREVRGRLIKYLGKRNTRRLISKSLFFIAIGSSDYLHNYLLPGSRSAKLYSPHEFQELLITSFSHQLQKLQKMGARKIAITGVGPLGSMPIQIDTVALADDGFTMDSINDMVKSFNDAIQGMISDLTNDMIGTFFTFSNTFDKFMQFIHNTSSNGFTDAKEPCCGAIWVPCTANTSICPDRASHVFWDKHHPTDRANLLLATSFTFGNDAAPLNLLDLARH